MRRTKLIVLLAGLAALAGLATWMLGGGGGESSGSTLQRRGADRNAAQLPEAEAGDAGPQALHDAALADAVATASANAEAAAKKEGPPSFTFRGRVVDDAGLPLAGATVVYWPNELTVPSYALVHTLWSSLAELAALPHAQTGADGRFELKALFAAGLGRRGFSDDPALVAIADGYANRTHSCKLYAGGDYDAGDIALEPGGWLEGRVVDGRGQPVAGATIKPWNPRTKSMRGVASDNEEYGSLSGVFAASLSGADGRFHTGGLWQGKVQVGFKAEGFLDRWIDDYQEVTAERATDLGDIVLDSGATLAGQVRDEAGAAIEGAHVVALSSGKVSPRWRERAPDDIVVQLQDAADEEGVTTDAVGRFHVPRLEATNHSLLVTAAGFDPQQIDDLMPGRADVGVVLQRAATLRLAVTSRADGRPLPGAVVHARRYSSRSFNPNAIELAVGPGAVPGSFVVDGLGRFLTRVTVSAPGHATQTLELDGATPPEAVEREEVLVPESVLAGRVLGDDGVPRPDADLVLSPKNPAVEEDNKPVHPDEAGRFEFRGLAAGEWTIGADADGWSPVKQDETLGEGEVRGNIEIILLRSGVVFGSCFREDGTPDAGTYLYFNRLTQDGGVWQQPDVRADAAGHYEVTDLPSGHWQVYGAGGATEFDLAAGQRLQLDLHDKPSTLLQGRVLSADGSPVPSAWVFVSFGRTADDRSSALCRTDERGHWVCKNAPPGHLDIAGAVTQGGGSTERVVIDLAEGEQRVLDLHIGNGRLTGRVVLPGDAPLAGAMVRAVALADDDGDIVYGNFGTGGEEYEFGASTDANGRFELSHLGAARYGVSVDAPGVRAEKPPAVELHTGETVDLLIPVERTGGISGRILLASGVPVHDGLYLRAEGPGQERSCRVKGGQYELKGLVAGEWRLTLEDQQRLIVDRAATLGAGQQLDLDLLAQP